MARDRNEAINSYITDMLALEDHIEKAVKSQLTDLKDYPEVLAELRQIPPQRSSTTSPICACSATGATPGASSSRSSAPARP